MTTLITAARGVETLFRRLGSLPAKWLIVRLLMAFVVAPGLAAIERFLDARAEAFSQRGWV
jgi:hypothetical protein